MINWIYQLQLEGKIKKKRNQFINIIKRGSSMAISSIDVNLNVKYICIKLCHTHSIYCSLYDHRTTMQTKFVSFFFVAIFSLITKPLVILFQELLIAIETFIAQTPVKRIYFFLINLIIFPYKNYLLPNKKVRIQKR